VLVKDAEIFIDTEVIGKMDPFVRLKLGSQQFKTTTKDEAGAHPVF
jgi:Ca2+-dependent lipid-binding protein